jgi:ABC-type spermidine/putrescine transport system permease subunit I
MLRLVTALYLVYLGLPIALLIVGSFGGSWLNTLLPTGFTFRWNREVAGDPSFRRAFASSLAVAALACTACVAVPTADGARSPARWKPCTGPSSVFVRFDGPQPLPESHSPALPQPG